MHETYFDRSSGKVITRRVVEDEDGTLRVENLGPDGVVDPAPSEEEDVAAMLVDHEYRLTLLELGVSGEV